MLKLKKKYWKSFEQFFEFFASYISSYYDSIYMFKLKKVLKNFLRVKDAKMFANRLTIILLVFTLYICAQVFLLL